MRPFRTGKTPTFMVMKRASMSARNEEFRVCVSVGHESKPRVYFEAERFVGFNALGGATWLKIRHDDTASLQLLVETLVAELAAVHGIQGEPTAVEPTDSEEDTGLP